MFRHYEGIGLLRKKDFVAFSGVVQREAGLPYSVLELKEVYSGEATENPLDRLIVHNDLIRLGYIKYRIRIDIQTGGYYHTSITDIIHYKIKYLEEQLGVPLRKWQVKKFVELFTDLNNYSHLWLNRGWSPAEFSAAFGRGPVQSVSVGPNMKRMFESGKWSREEFEKELKALGIKLIT